MHDARDEPISISAAAREIGVNKSTLARQLKGSPVPFHEGKVRLSDVLAFREASIDLTRSGRRDGRLDSLDGAAEDPGVDATPARVDATLPATPPVDATPDDDEPATVIVDGQPMSYADARALKETYLARLKGLELDAKRGELAPVAGMVAFVEHLFGTVRERLLAIPGKLSGDLDDLQAERLVSELHEALEKLSDPRTYAEHAGDGDGAEADGDLDDPEAAPRPNLVEWAERFRFVAQKTSAAPGRWKTAAQPIA